MITKTKLFNRMEEVYDDDDVVDDVPDIDFDEEPLAMDMDEQVIVDGPDTKCLSLKWRRPDVLAFDIQTEAIVFHQIDIDSHIGKLKNISKFNFYTIYLLYSC